MPMRSLLCLGLAGLTLAPGELAGPPPSAGAPGPELLGARGADPDEVVGGGRIEVTLTEGTNMAAALSPDGEQLALDLLGRIWIVPAGGGEATAITDPFGDARQPQWSPDGRRIAFQAYWTGDYDVWTVNADGTGLRQVTSGPYDDREPTWFPDGERVAFSSDRGGTYGIWEVDVGSGVARRRVDGPGNEYSPSVAPDGERLAWVTDDEGGAVAFGDGADRVTHRVELEGATGYAPSWSPNGRMVAYVTISGGRSELRVTAADGSAGTGSTVTGTDEDVFPFRASWARDGRLVYTGDGHVRSVTADGGREADIGFRATVTLERPSYRKRLRSFDPEGAQPVRGIVSPSLAPDGDRVAFSALGDLWVMEIGGRPRRLTDDPWVEADPVWSPDGSRLAYVSDREGGSDLYVRDLAEGVDRRLTTDGAAMPAWSPDGLEIAYLGGQGPGAGLRVVGVAGGASRTVRTGLNSPGRPTWAPDGESIAVSAHWRYSTRFREGVNRPLLLPAARPISQQDEGQLTGGSVERDRNAAEGERTALRYGGSGDASAPPPPLLQEGERWLDFAPHASLASRGTDGPVWSRDGTMMAYVASGVLWAVPVGPDGNPTGPSRRLNNERSSDPSWAADGRSILYLTDDRLRRAWLTDGRIDDVRVDLSWERSVSGERYTVHAGQVFNGLSSRLRRNVDIVVDGNRIVRVVDHDEAMHAGRVVDASEGVVAPGLIEMHMHGSLAAGESVGRQWLAFGVTSVRTPAADPFEMVEARESRASGRRLEPRLFGTGNTIDGSRIYYAGAPALTSNGQVELELAQAKALEFDLMKTYVRLSDPMQRRVIEEAHALGLPVTSHELYPAAAVGADGVEHVKGTSRRGYSPKVSELNRSYQDVVALLAHSGMTITPTVGIYGGYSLLTHDDPSLLDDPRVRVFVPESRLAPRRGGDPELMRPLVRDMASLGRRVVEQGGRVVVGTDAPIFPQGMSLIAEMEILVAYGGMTEIDVMRATTSISAAAMGYGDELGAIREGMLADMIVLGADPLRDIRAVRDVRIVIADGRVHTVEELLRRPGA
jgi:Tol biopolymer transport system component/imidazolonepropionase-like amidohydrolase